MIPRSVYNKPLYEYSSDTNFYFATNTTILYGGADLRAEVIKRVSGVTCLTVFKNRLYAGTEDGKILLARQERVMSTRKGPVLKFIPAKELYDVSCWGEEYFLTESLKPLEESNRAWLRDTPLIYYSDDFYSLHGNELRTFNDKVIQEFKQEPTDLLRIDESWWYMQGNILRDCFGNPMAELPSDCDEVSYDQGSFVYLTKTGMEHLIPETGILHRLFQDHIITCYTPATDRRKK